MKKAQDHRSRSMKEQIYYNKVQDQDSRPQDLKDNVFSVTAHLGEIVSRKILSQTRKVTVIIDIVKLYVICNFMNALDGDAVVENAPNQVEININLFFGKGNYGVTCEDEAKRRNSGTKTKTFKESCYLLQYAISSKEDTAYQRQLITRIRVMINSLYGVSLFINTPYAQLVISQRYEVNVIDDDFSKILEATK
ncbi:hypothetical protein Tco_1296411, partial [Tanacetum coccineum]